MVSDGTILTSETLCIAGAPIAADPREFADMFRDSYVDTLYFDALVSDSQGDAMDSRAINHLVDKTIPITLRPDFYSIKYSSLSHGSLLTLEDPSRVLHQRIPATPRIASPI